MEIRESRKDRQRAYSMVHMCEMHVHVQKMHAFMRGCACCTYIIHTRAYACMRPWMYVGGACMYVVVSCNVREWMDKDVVER
jgi:hypothetical protein